MQINESSFAGKSLIVNDPEAAAYLFFATALSETKDCIVEETGSFDVFISTAGATDFTIQSSRDTADAVQRGVAVWADAVEYSNRNGSMFLGSIRGLTALRVTCVKTPASAADDADIAASLGGRVQLRVVRTSAVDDAELAATEGLTPIPRGFLPVNTVLPAITGTPNVGEDLTVSDGTWTGYPAPTFTYQWLADDVAIDGETANTYTVAEALGVDISCTVTATNDEGVTSATSAAVTIVAP